MKNLNKTDIGLIGLAVMGENLALNMADKGWQVSVYNRTVPGVEEGVVERFMNGRARGKRIQGYTDMALFDDGSCRQCRRRADGATIPFAVAGGYTDRRGKLQLRGYQPPRGAG